MFDYYWSIIKLIKSWIITIDHSIDMTASEKKYIAINGHFWISKNMLHWYFSYQCQNVKD